MQTFTLDVITRSYEKVAFVFLHRACTPKPDVDARQTLSLGGTSTFQCRRLHYVSSKVAFIGREYYNSWGSDQAPLIVFQIYSDCYKRVAYEKNLLLYVLLLELG